MDIKDKTLTQKIIGCAFKVHNILGKGFLNNERINLNVIFRFILPILKYPVNPVSVFWEKRLLAIAPTNYTDEPKK